jgi:four helix bundle protein
MKDFRDLQVWEKAHRVTLEAYKVTASFPPREKYGLVDQIRRASASIPANIAEGCGGGTDAEFARFLQYAMGSASKLEYHHLLSSDLKILRADDYKYLASDVIEVKKMSASFIGKLH